MEAEVEEKILGKFDAYCESVSKDIKDEELAEAQAIGIALLFKELGLEEADIETLITSEAFVEGLKVLVEELAAAAEANPSNEEEAQTIDVNKAVEESAAVQALREQVEQSRKELAAAQVKAKVSELKAAFPYEAKAFVAMEKSLAECESADEVQAMYDHHVSVLKEAGMAEKKPSGSGKFLPTDTNESETEANRTNNTEVKSWDQQMLEEAEADFAPAPASNS
jgi:hypothetical protein